MVDRFIVYGLVDPRTDAVRYIGKSCSWMKRPTQHRQENFLRRDRTHKGNWVRQLAALGLAYRVEVLEVCPSERELGDVERFWISQAKGLGWPLTNISKGGDGGAMPPEIAKRTGEKLRGRPSPFKGRMSPPEERARLRALAQLPRPKSAEAIDRLRRRSLGNRHGAKLTLAQVEEIRALIAGGARQRVVAARFGVTQSCVSRALRGVT
jgi:hypothetical protein